MLTPTDPTLQYTMLRVESGVSNMGDSRPKDKRHGFWYFGTVVTRWWDELIPGRIGHCGTGHSD